LSGVEIEFSMDEGGSELLDDERGNETETEQSQGQAARLAPAGRGRITGTHIFRGEIRTFTETLL